MRLRRRSSYLLDSAVSLWGYDVNLGAISLGETPRLIEDADAHEERPTLLWRLRSDALKAPLEDLLVLA